MSPTDHGKTWRDAGANIAGLHGAVVQLKNSSLLAFGRAHDGPCPDDQRHMCLASSRSDDYGQSWIYTTSRHPAIHSAQRETLLRLQEGPLLFTGFANSNEDPSKYPDVLVTTANGRRRPVYGLYAALSYDEGNSWVHHKLITDNSAAGHSVQALDGELYTMNMTHSEPNGYAAATQSKAGDGLIHVITSRNHFAFNLAWLVQPSPDIG
jgi:sulfatase modifying factor 1